jgi:putative dehydrogenase
MKPLVAIIAQGAMGSGVARRLTEHGVEVRTSLAGRSAGSASRARAAGMKPVGDEEIAACDFLLSIVPPADALALARRFAESLARARRKPVFVDCNAVNPDTARAIASVVAATGCPFVDAGIIGGPPRPRETGPKFYASGPDAARFEALVPHGIEVRIVSAEVGDASALKMSYAGITKGLSALGTAMFLASARAGIAEPLRRELAESQPGLHAWFDRILPGMFGKAYRWVGEMEEIAAFVSDDKAAEQIFRGAAELYRRMAADGETAGTETVALKSFLAQWPAGD